MSATTQTRSKPDTLVYGIGGTGLSVARFLKREDVDAVYVDNRIEPPGLDELRTELPHAQVVLGQLPVSLLDDVSRLIVSPGIKETDEFLGAARQASIDIVSDIELFVEHVQRDFVAITGSNGKSTVTTLVKLMCEAAGLRALAGANLGPPALDLLAETEPDVYVLELSSFQLQRVRNLPTRASVLLNVTPDHLDWHASEAEYRRAKYRIFREAGAAVVSRDCEDILKRLHPDLPRITFGLDVPAAGQYGIVVDGGVEFLARGRTLLFACDDLAMVGRHNQSNALAALAAGELIGLDMAAMLQVLPEFPGLPHRMQFVGRVSEVDYVNDSKATNVGAAVASVRSVNGPVVLLAGGQGKGGDFGTLADATAEHLRCVVVFGEDAKLIEQAFEGKAPTVRVSNLLSAVEEGQAQAQPGDTVLLAPACASFDQFESYGRRGDAFVEIVRGLAA